MSEERLKVIEKEINYRLKKERIITVDFSVLCELYNEVIRLREELSKCTRKHWQSKCAEHCINEKLLQSRIEKAIEYLKENACYIESNIFVDDLCCDECMELLNILKGEE